MSIKFERTAYPGTIDAFWRKEVQMLPGGFTPSQTIPVGEVVQRGAFVSVDFDNMKAALVKICQVVSGGTTSKPRVSKKNNIYVGDLLTKDGKTYAAKLNRTDWNSFADGTDATAAAALCETMVRVPKCYYRASGQSMKLYGLTEAADSEAFDSPEWVGAYEMYVDSAGKGHSRPDVSPAHSKTMSAFWSCAQLLGTDWGLANYGFHKLINALFQCGYGNLNSQAAVGSGGQTSSWDAWRDVATGYGRTLGDGSGAAATSMSGQSCVKLFGFEDLWAKLWEFRPGIRFYYDSSAGKRYAVEYGGNTVSNTASGRTFEIPLLNAGGGYVTKMTLGEHWDMTPKAAGGGETTGYADGYWDNTSGQLLYVGGAARNGARCGVSCASSNDAFSYSGTSLGARLAFYGQPEIVSGSELVALAGAS